MRLTLHAKTRNISDVYVIIFFCLFVWRFSSNLRSSHSFVDVTIAAKAANFDLWSALMAIESPTMTWASVNNGHILGLVTITPIVEHLADNS